MLAATTLLCSSALASGCVSNPVRVGIEYCEHAKPIIWLSEQELLATPMPVTRQIVKHNEKVEALCR